MPAIVKRESVRTVMYSLDERGRVVTHHLPWPKDSPKIEPLKVRGFTFERPDLGMPEGVPLAAVKVPLSSAERMAKVRAARKGKVRGDV